MKKQSKAQGFFETLDCLFKLFVVLPVCLVVFFILIAVVAHITDFGLRSFVIVPQRYWKRVQEEYWKLTGTYDARIRDLVPLDSYYTDMPRRTRVADLRRFLGTISWPIDYKENEFDCSEMSAALEYVLEQMGFGADIAAMIRNKLFVPDVKHSWVIVWTDSGEMHVEPTRSPPEIVNPRRCRKRYRDIYGAIGYSGVREWDWWTQIEIEVRNGRVGMWPK